MRGETINRLTVSSAIVQGNNFSLYLNGERRVQSGWGKSLSLIEHEDMSTNRGEELKHH